MKTAKDAEKPAYRHRCTTFAYKFRSDGSLRIHESKVGGRGADPRFHLTSMLLLVASGLCVQERETNPYGQKVFICRLKGTEDQNLEGRHPSLVSAILPFMMRKSLGKESNKNFLCSKKKTENMIT